MLKLQQATLKIVSNLNVFDSRIPLVDEREPASLIVLMFPYNIFCRML